MRGRVVVWICGLVSSFGLAAHGIAALVTSVSTPTASRVVMVAAPNESERETESIAKPAPYELVQAVMTPPTVASTKPSIARCTDVIVHTVVASDDAAWSFASLTASGEHAIARRGAHVAGRTVVFVGDGRVFLADREGRTCHAEVYEPPPDRNVQEPRIAKPAMRNGGAAARTVDPEIARGIKATSPNSYDIDRGVFERIMQSTAEMMGDVRVSPDRVDGRVAGLTLARIRQGSVLSLVGLKDGDRLDAANGIELTGPEAGLEAYARLREAPHIVLKITRAGQPMEISYDVK